MQFSTCFHKKLLINLCKWLICENKLIWIFIIVFPVYLSVICVLFPTPLILVKRWSLLWCALRRRDDLEVNILLADIIIINIYVNVHIYPQNKACVVGFCLEFLTRNLYKVDIYKNCVINGVSASWRKCKNHSSLS